MDISNSHPLVISKPRSLTAREIRLIFTACAFPVHLWAVYNLLQEVPVWLMRLNLWDFLGVIAYTQAFALLESLILSGVLLLVLSLLPIAVIVNHRISLAAAFVFIHAIWAIVIHYQSTVIRTMGVVQLIPWMLLYLVSLVLVTLAVLRFEKLEKVILPTLERLEVLTYIYVFLDLVCVVIVIARNL